MEEPGLVPRLSIRDFPEPEAPLPPDDGVEELLHRRTHRRLVERRDVVEDPRMLPSTLAALLAAFPAFAALPQAPADAKPVKEVQKPPEEPRGLRLRDPGATPGYTLLAPLNSKAIHLVDLDGEVVHTWNTKHAPGGVTRFLPNGNLLRSAQLPDPKRFHGGGIAGRIEELDWDGNVVWEYELATEERILHHDFTVLPNGNLLCIAWEYHAPDAVRAMGRNPAFVHEKGLWADVLIEVERKEKKIVWEWRSIDHLVQDTDPKLPRYGKPADFPGRIDFNADNRFLPAKESEEDRRKREEREKEMRRVGYVGGDDDEEEDEGKDKPKPSPRPREEVSADWLHSNSVQHLPEHDLIVISTPHYSELWVIDHSTTTAEAASESGGRWKRGGALLYRYGNPRNYGRGDATTRKLFYQHDPTWITKPGSSELRLLVFNNGGRRPGKEHSSVEELVLPFDPKQGFLGGKDAAFGPAEPAWVYKDEERFFSAFISGAQRLANGNTLVCEGAKGRVFEVTPDGKVVWDFWSPLGGEIEPAKHGGKAPPNALFRAERLAPDHPGLRGKL